MVAQHHGIEFVANEDNIDQMSIIEEYLRKTLNGNIIKYYYLGFRVRYVFECSNSQWNKIKDDLSYICRSVG